MASELKLNYEKNDQNVKVYVVGEVDIYTSLELKDRLYSIIDENSGDLIIECSGLNYLDSTGLGILVATLKKAKQNNRNVYLSNLTDHIKKLFVITGLDKLFILN